MGSERIDGSPPDDPGGKNAAHGHKARRHLRLPACDADDAVVVARILQGDDLAMRALIERYDRLVRYTIFKTGKRYCERDPGWLDARANEVWTAIVSALRRRGADNLPPNIPAYFAQVSRNKCLDAVQRADRNQVFPFDPHDSDSHQPPAEDEENPLALLENLEQLESLRDCMSRLSESDRLICGEIGLIMEKRWREAADRLQMKESSLRTRWRGVIVKLKACLEKKVQKNGKSSAPDGSPTDS